MKKKKKKVMNKKKGWEISKKKLFLLGLVLSIELSMLAFLNDASAVKFIASLRVIYLDYLLLSVAFASNVFIIFFFLTSLFLWKEHKRRWILPLWLSSFFAILISYLMKIIIARPRPFQKRLVSALQIAIYFVKDNFSTWNFSFPSFQAVLVFSALPVLNKEFRKLKYVWFVFACLVAFSRVYFGLHYLSDVLAGAIIGYLIGLVMVKIEERYELGLKVMRKFGVSK